MKFLFRSLALFAIFISCNSFTEDIPIKGKIFRPGTEEHFEVMLERYDLILVDFFADWCGPCKQMHKVIDALAQDKDLDQILFIEVDTEVQRTLSNKYRISTLPTIIIFLDGKPLQILYGYQEKKSLKKILLEALSFYQ